MRVAECPRLTIGGAAEQGRKSHEAEALRDRSTLTSLLTVPSIPAYAADDGAVVVPKAELKWKEMGVPGLAAAQVSGDMAKGPSRFFLKYPVGLVTPKHHHTADRCATLVSGTIVLTVNGKDHTLGPGSYFALTKKAPHVARASATRKPSFSSRRISRGT